MKIATFMMPLHPPGKNYVQSLREDREAIILADELGYEEAYVGEHITDAAETVTHCMTFLASLIPVTKRIKLGAGTINIPNSHPAAIAAQVAMMDHLCEGRFIMGISPGGLASDAEVFGNWGNDRTAMFIEGINMVLKIWESEPPYNLEGKFWKITTEKTMIPEIGQGIILKPFQKPHPPIVGTVVAPYSKGVIAMAERGWLPISANFLMPEWVKTHWPNYVEGKKNIGQVADTADWRISAEGPYHFYFKQLIRKLVGFSGRSNLFKVDQNMPDSAITPEYVTDRLVLAGTVDSVVDQILAFREQVGDFGTLVYAMHDWMDPKLARRSMQLMAEQVMPKVNAALGKS